MAYTQDEKSTGLETQATLDDADLVIHGDTSDSGRAKAISWTNLKTAISTYIEGLASYFNVSSDNSDAITEGSTNLFLTSAERTKLSGVETSADVTDATNVAAAGAIMDSDFSTNGLMKRTGAGTYATATEDTDYQGVPAEGAFADGDKTKLDGIETSADVTDAANVASAGAVMADGSGTDITGDLVFSEKADHSSTPGAGKGYLWVKNTTPSTVVFTDDAGTDTTLGAGGGSGDMEAATYDPASIAEQLVGLTATQTLTNKTLTTPTLTLKQSTTPTPTAEGDIQWDSDNDQIVVGDGTGQKTFSDDSANAATYQPLDSDLTTIAAANNGSVLAATTASFLTADETKLDGIEAFADVTDEANVTTALPVVDETVIVYKTGDATAGIDFDATAITTATTRTIIMPDSDIDLANVPTSAEKTVLGNTSGTNSGDEVSASTTVAGVVELATVAETNTGTDTTRAVTPDGLAGSNFGAKPASVQVTDGSGAITTGDGQAYIRVTSELAGMNLVDINIAVTAPSTSGTISVMLARGRQSSPTSAHTFVDMLSTAVSIDANEYDSKDATTAAVINTSNDDVAEGDLIRIDVDGVGSGPTAVLIVTPVFQLP